MKKIIIIGCPGSGKTTFSLRLHERLGIPLFHLDAIWHKPDRTHIPREEFDTRLGEILARDSYIIDGNYSRTMERRVADADTVILFDLPTEVCLEGAISRLGTARVDMPWTDRELDPWLKGQIEGFREQSLPTITELLDRYRAQKRIVIFKSREDAELFLCRIGDGG
jgi:adenylate kinase family enzyme